MTDPTTRVPRLLTPRLWPTSARSRRHRSRRRMSSSRHQSPDVDHDQLSYRYRGMANTLHCFCSILEPPPPDLVTIMLGRHDRGGLSKSSVFQHHYTCPTPHFPHIVRMDRYYMLWYVPAAKRSTCIISHSLYCSSSSPITGSLALNAVHGDD